LAKIKTSAKLLEGLNPALTAGRRIGNYVVGLRALQIIGEHQREPVPFSCFPIKRLVSVAKSRQFKRLWTLLLTLPTFRREFDSHRPLYSFASAARLPTLFFVIS
jgi:hypothetical protein